MPRFLFAAWPTPGHYFPLIAVAKALQERGHECALYTGPAGGPAAQAEGLTWFPFRALDDAWFDRLIYGQTFSRIRALQMAQLNRRVQALILESIPNQVHRRVNFTICRMIFKKPATCGLWNHKSSKD